MIYNQTLSEGTVPEDWKTANVSAIYKKGNKAVAGNYRPVSLTCIICKVLESIVRERIMCHMTRNRLFSEAQYGFIPGRSTVMQLLRVLDDWTQTLDEGGRVDVVYMDFQKAFDTVAHTRLLHKLTRYGITGTLLRWIEIFLTGRRQRVAVNGSYSDWIAVLSGIPQGSVLGPLLFVIFINDLPDCVRSSIYLFADDTKIYRRVSSKEDQDELQADLDSLQEWSNRWLLKFHPEKCKTMSIKTPHKSILESSYHMTKTVNNITSEIELEKVSQEKDLGVLTDQHLNFEEHLNQKANKANQMMGLIRRSFHYLDTQTFRWLFKALVRPHLEYAQAVWSPLRKKDVNTLENVQRRATKLIPGLRDLSYPERLRNIDIPTLAYRRLRGDMVELYKIISGRNDPAVGVQLTKHEGPTRGNNQKL